MNLINCSDFLFDILRFRSELHLLIETCSVVLNVSVIHHYRNEHLS